MKFVGARVRGLTAALAAATVLSAVGHATAQVPLTFEEGGGRPTLAPLLKDVTPSVVNIAVTSLARPQANPLLQDPLFRRFFEAPDEQAPAQRQHSVGSGVIVDAKNGYILTNNHVVADGEDIVVTLKDRRSVKAELVGSDAGTDVAVLKVPAEGLTAISVGDSDKLQVGDFVVAIGNPFGLGQTVTSGIVSALGRSGLDVEGYEDFIQTDASINPGNSGGALIDLDGRLVGLNTAILAPAGGNIGIGFAVPANMAKRVMQQVLEYGEVRRGQLGVMIQELTPDLAEALALDVKEGAVVNGVQPGSAADRAGIKGGDVVIEFNGSSVTGAGDLRNKVGLAPVGTTLPITVLRDGKRQQLRVAIEANASSSRAGAGPGRSFERLKGAEFSDSGGRNSAGAPAGAAVVRVEPGSPAEQTGLRAGDIVVAVNRTPVGSAADLERLLRSIQGKVALGVQRGDRRLYVVVR